ncbi:hypothetical protein GW932_00675 [archaeon]|nr:hypothetical protein [archaeon]
MKIKTAYSDLEIKFLLDKEPEDESNLVEDLMIDQGDGTRACFNWELRTKSYTLVDQNKKYKDPNNMTDEELLADAYKRLKKYNSR